MRTRVFFVAGAALLGVGLAGCSNWSYDPPMRGSAATEGLNYQAVRDTAVTTPAGFNRDLATGYAELADSLRKEHQWDDVDYFARKGIAAGRGEVRVPPESQSNWLVPLEVPDRLRSQLSDSRRRLMDALDGGAPQLLPVTAARAQVSYDCWIEHMETNWREAMKSACHEQFVTTLGQLEKRIVVRAATTPAVSGSSTRQYRVYFDTEGATPAKAAQPVLRELAARAKQDPDVRFLLIGKADRTGTHGHNLSLSERRVQAVREAMVAAGVPEARIEIRWVGERHPPINTAKAEVRNRVVEVSEQY